MLKCCLIIVALASVLVVPDTAHAYRDYDLHVEFLQTLVKDIVKLLPRAMACYLYQNGYDFFRGITFILRNKENGPSKPKDIEEIRREAYSRLLIDVPYCIEAFGGGQTKQDTSHANIASRLGLIAFSIYLLKLPGSPDLVYLKRFRTVFEEFVVENSVNVKFYHYGYRDFLSFAELMERLQPEFTLTLVQRDNKGYAAQMREDPFSMFRPPERMEKHIIITDFEVNQIYGAIINGILDAYMYIWRCSGMELAHPLCSAPPYTMMFRHSRGSLMIKRDETTYTQKVGATPSRKTSGSL